MLFKICRFFEKLSVLILLLVAALGIYSFLHREKMDNVPKQQDLVKEATDLAASMLGNTPNSPSDDDFHQDSRANGYLNAVNAVRAEMGIAPLELDYFLCEEATEEITLIRLDHSLPSVRILKGTKDLAGDIRGVTVMRGKLSAEGVMQAVRQSDNDTAQLMNRNYTKFGFASDDYGLVCVMIFSAE